MTRGKFAFRRSGASYLKLIARHGKHVAAYLAIEEPVTVKLNGRVYAW